MIDGRSWSMGRGAARERVGGRGGAVRALVFAMLILVIGASVPGLALASSLDSAKAAGQVGEKLDGYLAPVDKDASSSVKKLVSDVNAKRKQRYSEIAAKRGTETSDVAALAGQKLIQRAAAGEYVEVSRGQWQQKK